MATFSTVFNGAQTFFIDPSTVNNATQVMISSVDLYFKHKPALTQNYSGVATPGVSVFIVETMYGVPRITRKSGIFTNDGMTYVGYYNINTSSDASVPTRFRFDMPFLVDTNKEYAIVWRYDYLDQFQLWTTVQGDVLVGTTNSISPGPSGKYTGTYYDFLNIFVADDDTDLDEYLKNWRPVSDTDLKFTIYVARYSHSGVSVTANASISDADVIEGGNANVSYGTNSYSYDIRFGSYEFLSFDQEKSTKFTFVGGQQIFQDVNPYPGGYQNNKTAHSVALTAGSNTITALSNLPDGSVFQWTNVFPAFKPGQKIVFKSGSNYNVRGIREIRSNTVITVDEPVTFTNATANFLITPTGQVTSFEKQSPFGINESYVMIANSTANSTVRFVNNTIETLSVSVGGSGYSNGDILYVQGFENITNRVNGGYKAIGNVATNSSGGIVTVYMSNSGCGFVNSGDVSYVIANSTSGNTTSNTSAGTGATFTPSIGATVRTELTPNIFRGVKVRNIDVGEFLPFLELRNPPGVTYDFQIEMPYFRMTSALTYSGIEYYVSPNSVANRINITMYAANYTENMEYTPILPSKSNEFVIKYEDGSANDKVSNTESMYSLAFQLIGNVSSNSDYTCTMFKGLPSVMFSKYIVNNDATNEHTDSGNAWAKHITKVFSFERPAEDIVVYLTAYEPANTNLKVYARIHKDEDPESFDDKNWTLLEQKNTSDLSSSIDTSDYVELQFGFPQYAPTRTTLSGVGSTTLDSATITGSGTVFGSELATGDIILLQQDLFPNNHIVAVVDTVSSNTSFTITETISNTSLVAEGLRIDKIDSTYTQQAFNNIQKSNIVRYFNSTQTKFDGYDKVAVKVVFLTDDPHRVPRIDDIKATGVSA